MQRRTILIICITVALAGCMVAGVIWWLKGRSSSNDPFTAKTLSAAGIPLYYPTRVPKGYRVDPKSVTLPETGVVTFDLTGPNSQKIYVSEEARPTKFDLGGYYNNFQDRQTRIVPSGTIAVGHINNGKVAIASIAINRTWILANTPDQVPLSQLEDMFSSFVLSY